MTLLILTLCYVQVPSLLSLYYRHFRIVLSQKSSFKVHWPPSYSYFPCVQMTKRFRLLGSTRWSKVPIWLYMGICGASTRCRRRFRKMCSVCTCQALLPPMRIMYESYMCIFGFRVLVHRNVFVYKDKHVCMILQIMFSMSLLTVFIVIKITNSALEIWDPITIACTFCS